MAQTNPENGQAVVKDFTKKEKFQLYKNILIIGFAFMVHFTAFHGTANLQSSVNSSRALGTLTLAAIYGSLIFSNIILPVLVIGWLGCKWTIALSFIAYMPFIGAQFFPAAYTLIPAGLMVGLGGGPLWCAKCTYLTVVAEVYAENTGQSVDALVTRFFGIFFMFYQLAQVWGNLISSAILSMPDSALPITNTGIITTTTEALTLNQILNTTLSSSKRIEEICGANFCGDDSEDNPNLEPPSAFKMNMLAGIYLACMIGAVLCVALGVDRDERYASSRSNRPKGTVFSRLMATVRQAKDPYQLLLIPATLFIGAEQAFLAAEFNAAFVACAWGISNIGFVMICFGVFNAIGALLTGAITKVAGRYPVMIIALLLHSVLIGSLLVWKPSPEQKIGFFLIAGLWGLADSIWLIHINSISGILFPGREEASFSNFRLWEATGSVIVYSYASYICASTQIYVSILIMLVGILGYTAVEILETRTKKGKFINRGFSLVSTTDNGEEGKLTEKLRTRIVKSSEMRNGRK